MRPDHPFVPWVLALVVTSATVLAGRAVAIDPSDLWDHRIGQRLADMTADTDVAVIGTCLIQPVIGVSRELEEGAGAVGLDLTVVRLLRPGRDWDWEPLVEELGHRPPAVVIIEFPVLVRNLRPAATPRPGMVESLQQVRSAVLAVASAAPRLPSTQDVREAWWRRDVATFESGTWPVARLDAADIEIARSRHFHEPSARGLDALRTLAARSRAVIAVALPPHPNHPLSPSHKEALDRVTRMLTESGIVVMAPAEVGASGFIDQAHLNQRGAGVIRAALVRELQRFLGTP